LLGSKALNSPLSTHRQQLLLGRLGLPFDGGITWMRNLNDRGQGTAEPKQDTPRLCELLQAEDIHRVCIRPVLHLAAKEPPFPKRHEGRDLL
jgi:hypothetical protein